MINIEKELLKNIDLKYKNFNSKLIPNINNNKILGVKVPIIREISKNIKEEDAKLFKKQLPHKYHEENMLHAFLISNNQNIDKTLEELDTFLPYIDNWQITDALKPKIFKKNKEKVYKKIIEWSKSNHTYTVRYAIVTLLTYYLDDNFKEEYNNLVINIKKEDYYILMAKAWYFSYALIKQYNKTIKIFENKILSKELHNKSIQKAIESYRIDNNKKNYLKSLKIY